VTDLLKILPIYFFAVLTSIWYSFVNFQFLFSKIKSGIYTVPYTSHIFEKFHNFVAGAYLFNMLICYFPAIFLTAIMFKISVDRFGGLSSALMVNHATSVLASVLFIRLLSGETPNRNGWIAIILILTALPFAANSSTNIKP